MVIALVAALLLQAQAVRLDDDSALDAEIAEVCKAVLCRTPSPVRLKLRDGTTFEMTPPVPMPIVSGDHITVLAGEKVWVEADVKDGRLTNLVAVRRMTHPERTLVFDFKQEPTIGDGTGMILQVESPFAGIVKYRLGMMLVSDGRLRQTSTCPLVKGKTSFEHWPHPVFQLAAGDFRLVDAGSDGALRCE